MCAIPTSRGDNRLAAYLTTKPGASLTAAGLRRALRETLPERELPTTFVFVDSFPMTPRGKVDRDQLARIAPPSPPAAREDASTDTGETEEVLAAIWSRALDVERVGPDDDFFELGGDSLRAAVIAAGVHAAFGVQLDLGAVVDNPTVARMARAVEDCIRGAATTIARRWPARREPLPCRCRSPRSARGEPPKRRSSRPGTRMRRASGFAVRSTWPGCAAA